MNKSTITIDVQLDDNRCLKLLPGMLRIQQLKMLRKQKQ